MNRIALVVILGLVAAYLVPVLLPGLSRISHRHVIVGDVSPEDLEAHVRAETDPTMQSAGGPQLHSGLILSIPFGELLSYFANLGVCILLALTGIGIVAFHARMRIPFPSFQTPSLRVVLPPPRFV